MHIYAKRVAIAVAVQMASFAATARAVDLPVVPSFDHIRLVRTVCFGACPAYSVTIFGDGRVVYEGERFVRKVGRAKSRLSREQLDRLVLALREVDFFSLRDK